MISQNLVFRFHILQVTLTLDVDCVTAKCWLFSSLWLFMKSSLVQVGLSLELYTLC